MVTIVSWILLVYGSLGAYHGEAPTVVFVPGWVLNWVSLPEADFACELRTRETFADILGTQFRLDNLQDMVAHRSSSVIRVHVDQNHFSPAQALPIFARVRKDWSTKGNTIIFVTFFRVETLPNAKSTPP
jgi:hypothetical protein